MRVLLITPEYASHYLPLSALGRAWAESGSHVVVATGQVLSDLVRRDGFDHVELRLSEWNNSGLLRPELKPARDFAASLEAAKDGMVAMLSFQAERRLPDLLWQPDAVMERLGQILDEVQPTIIVSVALGYNATAALLALDRRFASFVTGHPSEFPARGEVYGFPYYRPSCFAPTKSELAGLANICRRAQDEFTTAFNRFVQRHNCRSPLLENGLAAASSDLIIFNYPEILASLRKRLLPSCATFVGSSVRNEELDVDLQKWIERGHPDQPTIYVSFGSFFSIRTDVLARVVEALRNEPVRVVLAHGVSDPLHFGTVPDHWLVGKYLPQVAILPHCDLVICHGGNNTVTESLTYGIPLLVGPFSSDQFGGAADVEEFKLGAAFDPNKTPPEQIRKLAWLALQRQQSAQELSRTIRSQSGPAAVPSLCLERIPNA